LVGTLSFWHSAALDGTLPTGWLTDNRLRVKGFYGWSHGLERLLKDKYTMFIRKSMLGMKPSYSYNG
jgi:hypothetical protein